MYTLSESWLVKDTVIWYGEFWTGILGTIPGTGTGTQTVESFHSFWQSLLKSKLKSNPLEFISLMQGLYEKQWKHLMATDAEQWFSIFFGCSGL